METTRSARVKRRSKEEEEPVLDKKGKQPVEKRKVELSEKQLTALEWCWQVLSRDKRISVEVIRKLALKDNMAPPSYKPGMLERLLIRELEEKGVVSERALGFLTSLGKIAPRAQSREEAEANGSGKAEVVAGRGSGKLERGKRNLPSSSICPPRSLEDLKGLLKDQASASDFKGDPPSAELMGACLTEVAVQKLLAAGRGDDLTGIVTKLWRRTVHWAWLHNEDSSLQYKKFALLKIIQKHVPATGGVPEEEDSAGPVTRARREREEEEGKRNSAGRRGSQDSEGKGKAKLPEKKAQGLRLTSWYQLRRDLRELSTTTDAMKLLKEYVSGLKSALDTPFLLAGAEAVKNSEGGQLANINVAAVEEEAPALALEAPKAAVTGRTLPKSLKRVFLNKDGPGKKARVEHRGSEQEDDDEIQEVPPAAAGEGTPVKTVAGGRGRRGLAGNSPSKRVQFQVEEDAEEEKEREEKGGQGEEEKGVRGECGEKEEEEGGRAGRRRSVCGMEVEESTSSLVAGLRMKRKMLQEMGTDPKEEALRLAEEAVQESRRLRRHRGGGEEGGQGRGGSGRWESSRGAGRRRRPEDVFEFDVEEDEEEDGLGESIEEEEVPLVIAEEGRDGTGRSSRRTTRRSLFEQQQGARAMEWTPDEEEEEGGGELGRRWSLRSRRMRVPVHEGPRHLSPLSPEKLVDIHSKFGRRKRSMWTETETEALIQGVRAHGTSWAFILQDARQEFAPWRTQHDLKDRYRNLLKKGVMFEVPNDQQQE